MKIGVEEMDWGFGVRHKTAPYYKLPVIVSPVAHLLLIKPFDSLQVQVRETSHLALGALSLGNCYPATQCHGSSLISTYRYDPYKVVSWRNQRPGLAPTT
uniref:Uncharacterized protein n=1 Tax=Oryza rufipogon TaxID=4529 RepID=A0A0E0NXJ0_ORYRU